MKFLVFVKATAESEAGKLPSTELIEAMGRFNGEMAQAGVMLAGEGLHPSSAGFRLRFTEGEPAVTPGPFQPAGELVSGLWIIQAASPEEALSWVRRAPFPPGAELELRRVMTPEDYGAAFTADQREREQRLRDEIG